MMKPIIGIPMGDPCGIGPEIAVKAFNHCEIYESCNPVIIGDANVIRDALLFTHSELLLNIITDPTKCKFEVGTINLIPVVTSDLNEFKIGTIQAIAGKAAFGCIKKAVELSMSKMLDAIATTPINKEALRAANINYIGHTEIFAGLTNSPDPLTMFEVKGMRVFFLSRHVSLKKACEMVTKDRVLEYIIRCCNALKKIGIFDGTMAVAGLNPHSGEHGLFGDEEMIAIEPAIIEARALGYDVVGPIGADSVFHLALQGRFNSVLSMYHDQGHIATKTLDFNRTIAITNGLPFLRTSVDHGTAMDIAGKGIASEISMVEAILLAAKYSPFFSI